MRYVKEVFFTKEEPGYCFESGVFVRPATHVHACMHAWYPVIPPVTGNTGMCMNQKLIIALKFASQHCCYCGYIITLRSNVSNSLALRSKSSYLQWVCYLRVVLKVWISFNPYRNTFTYYVYVYYLSIDWCQLLIENSPMRILELSFKRKQWMLHKFSARSVFLGWTMCDWWWCSAPSSQKN